MDFLLDDDLKLQKTFNTSSLNFSLTTQKYFNVTLDMAWERALGHKKVIKSPKDLKSFKNNKRNFREILS